MELLIFLGCASSLTDPSAYLTDARVLAVQFEPAEAEEGEAFTLRALYADEAGPLDDADVAWSACTARKPLADAGPVASSCLVADSDDLAPIASGLEVTGTIPDDACSLFGPNPPPADEGGVAGRPVDPDVSGGFYQPIVGFDDGVPTLAAARVRCGLADVSQEDYVSWNLAYHDNENPDVAAFTVDGVAIEDGAPVGPGAAVGLAVSWPECPVTGECGDGVCSGDETSESCAEDCEAASGCGGAETYALWDTEAKSLATVRETLSVSWFATGGTFEEARGGRAADDVETDVSNTWTPPEDPQDVWLGVVLHDDRGGVGFAGGWVRVE
jgi:hypothetical protein